MYDIGLDVQRIVKHFLLRRQSVISSDNVTTHLSTDHVIELSGGN